MTATATQQTTQWSFDLSLQKPLSLNDREHWSKRNARVQQVREEAGMMAKVADVPRKTMAKVKVTLTFIPPDRRRRDVDNLVATYKAVCDGLVDVGVVPDDTPAEMVKVMPVIGEPQKDLARRFLVEIERVM